MNERLIVKSFGPVKDIDITFKKVTLFIGDQGTGKSCVAKLFSMFKWLEKCLGMQHQAINYYEQYNRFKTKLCAYHRIDTFFRNDTYIKFEGRDYDFEYKDGVFHVSDKGKKFKVPPKIMYVPAERSILSVAENRPKLLKELPDSCATFFDEVVNAKLNYQEGYNLPFESLRFEYDPLNDVGWVRGEDYRVRLINASSGIQSALPLCMVSEYLSRKVLEREDIKISKEERTKMEKRVKEILQNKDYSEEIKDIMLKQLSATSRYGCFINIVEEPELNLFPKSQMDVLYSLVKNNAASPDNMLVLTTHSPYTLAIFNLMILASKVTMQGDNKMKKDVADMLPLECHVSPDNIVAFRLSEREAPYCKSIIGDISKMISKNDLDIASEDIMQQFNALYRLYAKVIK